MVQYNLHIHLRHVNQEVHLLKIRQYLMDKSTPIEDLYGSWFKVRFSSEGEVTDFIAFLKTLEGGNRTHISVRAYHGTRKVDEMSHSL
ncbi:hypothetical protein A3A78_04005 [candidate division WWE3 bacterium RIFCSPLOWO2_01_FULL_41_18]|uniref:Uncharacterized protein n=1 Tax=candidate division WWE3 bacterium RIFCSPLOWO2_01_FULL_41_18 TaxID=1802625 RepID=A0A1F4VD97_UNCKA|nr:MAG: hypothetical protein A3A78_04005 [candidate division WWE3 bacterium RIFCSPLOWO2_01_FULL_41_18]